MIKNIVKLTDNMVVVELCKDCKSSNIKKYINGLRQSCTKCLDCDSIHIEGEDSPDYVDYAKIYNL